jgi:hypothetical protein
MITPMPLFFFCHLPLFSAFAERAMFIHAKKKPQATLLMLAFSFSLP